MTYVILGALLAAGPVAVPRPVGEELVAADAFHYHSPAREFTAVVEFEAGNTEFVPFSRFELRDAAGRTIYAKPGSGHTVLDVSDDGFAVGIDFDGPVSGRARLHFYDLQGVEQGSAEVGFLNQRTFSDDGRTYCVLDGRAGLRAFRDGRELYALGPGHRFAVSADGSRLALAQDSVIRLFAGGREKAVITGTTPFVRQVAFSGDGERVGWVECGRLSVRRFEDGGLVFECGPPEPGMRFISLDLSADGRLVLAGLDEGKPHRRGLVWLLDPSGAEVWRRELAYGQWNIEVPAVRFGAPGSFEVRTADRSVRYEY
ncbi:hypothetical protein FJY71_03345 [candidate division WOR-3 bacterium]|nr:hypothetical protein [candidate division WOR-3 bacterium]